MEASGTMETLEAKESLETKVRDALIAVRTDELVSYVSDIPGYKAMLVELANDIMTSVRDSLATTVEGITEEELDELEQDVKELIRPQIEALDDPEQLRKTMHEKAELEYRSAQQEVKKLSDNLTDMREDFDKEILVKYANAHKSLLEFAGKSDIFVSKLVKIAEKEGIDKAVQKETRYSVIREMFPTIDEYKAFSKSKDIATKNFLMQVENILMTDGELGRALGGIYGAIGNLIDKTNEKFQEVCGTYLEKEIQEIYGQSN